MSRPSGSAQLAGHLIDAGADRLSFGDTTGMATPRRVHDLLDALERAGIAADRVGLHFHDTRGTALANVVAALGRGVTRFDASIGGLGGCPYAPGASGNAVTEDLVHMCHDMGIETGIDLDALLACAELAERDRRSGASERPAPCRTPKQGVHVVSEPRDEIQTVEEHTERALDGNYAKEADKLALQQQAVRARPARAPARRRTRSSKTVCSRMRWPVIFRPTAW